MHTRLSMLARTVGQLGILTSAALAVAPYPAMLPHMGEFVALASPTQLAFELLELLYVPACLVVCWVSSQRRHEWLALGGCGVLACLLTAQLAVLQSMTGMYSWWGAAYLFSNYLFPFASVGLLAASYPHPQPGTTRAHTPDPQSWRRSRSSSQWLAGIAAPLAGVSALGVWSGRLPSVFLISIAVACVLYALQRQANRHALPAPAVPVAALLTALATGQCGLVLAVTAIGPIPMTTTYDYATTVASALTALTLTAIWAARAHRTRNTAATRTQTPGCRAAGETPPAVSPPSHIPATDGPVAAPKNRRDQ